MRKKLLLIFLFCFAFGFCQEKVLEGKIKVNAPLQNITIENISREISVQADENGIFKIIATPEDVLVFSSVGINKKVFFIKEEHFDNPIEIELKTTSVEIDEVQIDNTPIMSFGGKKYTPAERTLKTGGQVMKMNQGFEFNLEAIGNLFNGKRKQLKKALEIENTEKRLLELDFYFDTDFYITTLGLSEEYINDFKYFLVDDKNFQKVLETQDENNIILEAIKLYESYQKNKSDEK